MKRKLCRPPHKSVEDSPNTVGRAFRWTKTILNSRAKCWDEICKLSKYVKIKLIAEDNKNLQQNHEKNVGMETLAIKKIITILCVFI